MKVEDLSNGIEVFKEDLCGRKKFFKIISRIPNIKIIEKHRTLSWFVDGDIFCKFELNGKRFEVGEPFGDFDSYWILSKSPESDQELYVIKNFLINYH